MRSLPWTLTLSAIASVGFAEGCTGPDSPDDDPGPLDPGGGPTSSEIVSVTASGSPSTWVPSVLWASWDGPPGVAHVEYGLDGALTASTPDTTGASAPVIGLKAGRSYTWRVVIAGDDGLRHVSDPATFDVPLAPLDLLPITVELDAPEAELAYFAGSMIRSPDATFAGQSWAVIVDRDGDYVWWVDTGGTVSISPKLGYDGRSLAWNQYDFGKQLDRGALVRVSFDGQDRVETRLRLGQHDFYQHDDGTVAFIGSTFADMEVNGQMLRMGSDTLSLGPEGMTDADEPVLFYDQFLAFPQEPAITCNHIAEPGTEFGVDDVHEWTHANSLMYLPETDSYYVNDRYTDWLFKVNASGAVDWVLNGAGSDFSDPSGAPVWTGVSSTTLWSHGHMSDLWDGGGLMFDNGDHHQPAASRVVEFAYDEVARTAEVVWSFDHPEGAFTQAIGDARRMPAGDVLITWAGVGDLHEVTRDGRIVWQASYPAPTAGGPPGETLGRLVPLDSLYGSAR